MYIGNKKTKEKDISRYFNKKHGSYCVKILPGEYYYTSDNELIATTLGSCVSACIWDEKTQIGGMNHFMLPLTEKEAADVTWGSFPTESTRYGNYAMEYLINEILKNGGKRETLRVKLFGGGKVLNGAGNVGERNVDFVLDYVKMEGIPIAAHDLGSNYPRKVLFNPITGQAWMKRINNDDSVVIARRENDYSNAISTDSISGDVDLF